MGQNGTQVASASRLNGQGIIVGKVLDAASKSPIEYASVMLMDKQNGQMVTGMASDKNGEFALKSIPNGSYNLSVLFVGFKKKIVNDISISDASPVVNLKEIVLLGDAVQMKETEVVTEKSAVEFKIDKKVVNVSQNLAAAGGTAVDVLQNQPSVQVDANGNLTLRGNGNFTVMVDGRPSVLTGTDALRQIPANIIDNIEIITNPSAKYDAEGITGIINIVTKRTGNTNMNGMANAGVGSRDKYNGDFNFNYRTDDYNIMVGGDARRSNNFQDAGGSRNTTNSYSVKTDVGIANRRDAYTFRLGYDSFFDQQTTLAFTAMYGYVNVNSYSFTTNDVALQSNSSFIPSSTTKDYRTYQAKYVNGSLNFTHNFIPKVSSLVFEATFTTLDLPSDQNTYENFYASPINTNAFSLTQGLDNGTTRKDSRIKLNYSHKFTDKQVLEAGVQGTLYYKDMDLKYRTLNNATQVWQINNLLSNSYDYRNNVYAAFVTYSDQLLGLDYQAGLRLEGTDRKLDLLTTNNQFKYSKVHLFPTLNISAKLTEDQQMQFSYSRRIFRPGDGQLNPFEFYSDTYTVIKGNPYLLPSFTNSLELNYQKTFKDVFLTVQTYLRQTEDGIEQTQQIDQNNRFNLTFDNSMNSTAIGAEISANISVAPFFKLDPAVNLYNFHNDANAKYSVKADDNFAWNARLTTTLMLSAETRIQFFTNYFGKQFTSQGEIKPFSIIGATVRQEFFDKKLIATLSAQNLFDQTKFQVLSKGGNFASTFYAVPEAPVFNLTISINLNNFRRRTSERVDINEGQGF